MVTASEQLMERIEQLVRDGNAAAIQRIVSGQISIVTQLEAENAVLVDAYQSLRRSAVQFATAVVGDDDPPTHVLAAYGDLLDELYPADALVAFGEQSA